MLSWIKGGTSDHPLDSQDARDSLQADLARMSPVMALSQLATYLNDVKTAKNLRPARALEIIDLLDRMGGPLQRKLTRDHLAPREPLTKFHENRIWTAVYTYARELADVYRLCLAQYQVGAAGSAVLKRRLPQITCRALRACATQLKWMLLRYGPVEQRLWQELCGLYRLSESLGFAQVNCAMYPRSIRPPSGSSCARGTGRVVSRRLDTAPDRHRRARHRESCARLSCQPAPLVRNLLCRRAVRGARTGTPFDQPQAHSRLALLWAGRGCRRNRAGRSVHGSTQGIAARSGDRRGS